MDTFGESVLLPQQERKDKQLLFEIIEKALVKRQQAVVRDFKKKHHKLVTWMNTNGHTLPQLQIKATQFLLSAGFSALMIGGTLVAQGPPTLQSLAAQSTSDTQAGQQLTKPNPTPKSYDALTQEITTKIAAYKSWPSEQQEIEIGSLVSELTGVKGTPVLDGHKMNKLYGFFGKEQHLYRYPGDSLAEHALNEEDKRLYLPSGIAPGLGAWGYFAPSKTAFTKKDEMRERYYIAAQTFLFPGFYNDKEFRSWLKFRKVIIYHPKNQRAVVAVIGDAGPATWTGKSFGGSPEVMHHLQMVDGAQKTEAIVLFVDDPEDKIPLGPVQLTPKNAL